MLAFLGLCFVILMPFFVTSVQATPIEVGGPARARGRLKEQSISKSRERQNRLFW